MTRKQKRLAWIGGIGAVLAVAVGLVVYALSDQITFFYSPTEIASRGVGPGTAVRLGGMVKAGSWTRQGEANDFVVTDGKTDIPAHFVGLLPDLFREGQGVVVEGNVTPQGTFAATNVLAKHDENYMPREMVEKLKANGEWQRTEAGS